MTQKRFIKAETLLKKAIALDEKFFGLEHSEVAKDLSFLAKLYRKQLKFEASKALYERALKIYIKTLGPNSKEAKEAEKNIAFFS